MGWIIDDVILKFVRISKIEYIAVIFMEWLLQKALEHPGESYSPQQVAEMLDKYAEAIVSLNSKINILTWTILALIITFKAINMINDWRFDKRLKNFEK